jgi:hypothetical protein
LIWLAVGCLNKGASDNQQVYIASSAADARNPNPVYRLNIGASHRGGNPIHLTAVTKGVVTSEIGSGSDVGKIH